MKSLVNSIMYSSLNFVTYHVLFESSRDNDKPHYNRILV